VPTIAKLILVIEAISRRVNKGHSEMLFEGFDQKNRD